MFDIIALGELLVDFTPHGMSEAGNRLYETNPGGAPANVLAASAKLGGKTAFIGKVGEDRFGDFLAECLWESKIDISGLSRTGACCTTLAFVHLSKTGDRSFSFYRNPGADMMLDEFDIDKELIKNTRIFHCGSISMTDEPARSATKKALQIARENNVIISYDPNLRPALWRSLDEARDHIISGLEYADIVKISEEELEFITGEKDLVRGSERLAQKGGDCMLVTLGARGTFYKFGNITGRLNTYAVSAVDTTGAGDAFLGGILYQLKNMDLSEIRRLSKEDIEEIVDFGNAVGALTTTKKGALPAVPTMEEVRECMKNEPKFN